MTEFFFSNGVWVWVLFSILAPTGYLISSKRSEQIQWVVGQYIISAGLIAVVMVSTAVNTRYIIKHVNQYTSDSQMHCVTITSEGKLIRTKEPIGAVGDTLWLRK